MKLYSVKELDARRLRGKRVLLRVDFNVPVGEKGVFDDTRMRAALPTINYLRRAGAKMILVSHLGRPTPAPSSRLTPVQFQAICKKNKMFSLKRVASYLETLTHGVKFVDEPIGSEALAWTLGTAKDGSVTLLENIRFYPGEEKNDAKFAEALAELADFFVNDAFSALHRAHASIVGVAKLLPSYAGLLVEKEVGVLGGLLEKPKKPFIVMLGGVKISDKVGVIRSLSKRADKILLGGALINSFYMAMGCDVGASFLEKEGIQVAKRLLKNKKIVLPVDVVVGDVRDPGRSGYVVDVNLRRGNGKKEVGIICAAPYAIYDVGPKTILEYAKVIKKAKTLVWNGPLGMYEIEKFSHGTLALGRLFASRSCGRAYGVAGGGETLHALKLTGMRSCVDWISTGGGAMLEFLEGKILPGLKPLIKK